MHFNKGAWNQWKLCDWRGRKGEDLQGRPCLRHKNVKLYTLFKTEDPENDTLTVGTSLYRKYMGVPPLREEGLGLVVWRYTVLSWQLCMHYWARIIFCVQQLLLPHLQWKWPLCDLSFVYWIHMLPMTAVLEIILIPHQNLVCLANVYITGKKRQTRVEKSCK